MSPALTSNALLSLLALTLIHGTALALLTWAADVTVLRRCRPSLKAALWTVVLVKFLLPPVLPVSFGLSALIGSLAPSAERSVTAAPRSHTSERPDDAESSGRSSIYERAIVPEDSRPLPQPGRRSRLPVLLLSSYAALLLFLTSKAILHSRRAGRRLRRLPAAGAALSGEVCELARRLGLRRAPPVRLDAESATPYVIGAWSPTLVLPAGLSARLDPAVREALIIHELAHIGRGDVLVRWLQNVARLVFFFWPPVWWLCRRIERYSEMACDQWAIRFSPASPRLYAESLLDVAKSVRAGALVRHELGFAAARRSGLMRARFELILGGARDASPHLSWPLSAVLLGWGLFALTGSVNAGAETRARAAGSGAARLAPITPIPEESEDVVEARGAAARADAAQDEPRERGHMERRARAARRAGQAERTPKEGAPARDAGAVTSEEVSALQPAAAPSQNPLTASNPDDLDGDGRVSHFEAGFSAGRRHDQRRRSRPTNACASCEPCTAGCGTSDRRREIEHRARRQRFPDSRLP